MPNILAERKSTGRSFTIGGGNVDVTNLATKQELADVNKPDLLVQYTTPYGGSPLIVASSGEMDGFGVPNPGVTLSFSEGIIDNFGLWAGAFPTGIGNLKSRMKVTGNQYVDKKITVNFGASAIFTAPPAGTVELIYLGELRLKNGGYIGNQKIWAEGLVSKQRESYMVMSVRNYTFDAPTFAYLGAEGLKARGFKFQMPDGERFLTVADIDVWISVRLFQNSGDSLRLATCTTFFEKVGE